MTNTIKVIGKGKISAEVVADSISAESGKRITTFVLEYPRFIHAEFMTHRVISKNSASSRAIPVAKVIEAVGDNPAMPVHWGKNQAGMQAKEELEGFALQSVQTLWVDAAEEACQIAESMTHYEAHKQVVNRILEPFQFMRVVATATDWNNFYFLRNHPDAQPEIAELARVMSEAHVASLAEVLKAGEWHTPFVWHARDSVSNELSYHIGEINDASHKQLTLEEALKVSASMCAQVSFRKSDDSLEKAIAIYDRLVNSKPVHASPFEHQACPIGSFTLKKALEFDWPKGITHMDRDGHLWSGNFCNWIQHRQLIPENAVRG